jgi:FAD/FMN-containing dehydrogenase
MTTITETPQTTVIHKPNSIETLRSRIDGEVLTPESRDYADVKLTPSLVSNNRHPQVIIRATSAHDVAEAVRFARGEGRPLAVRSGGHSVPGYNMVDGAIVVDLSLMRDISIDASRGTACVGPGANSGELINAGHAYGLALSTGDTATVGLGGLTTGGGIGFMVRKFGLTIDNLTSAQVVLASGEIVRASANDHADLFWAIRGGGGNFGIITEFEFQMARVGQVLGGALVLPGTKEVLRGYHDYVANAPEDLTTIANLMHAPPAPFIPEERVGELVLMVLAVWTGDIEEGEKAFAPLRALADPVADAIAPIPYPVIYEFTRDLEQRHGVAIKSMFTDGHSDASLDAIIDAMNTPAGPLSLVMFRGIGGGAMSRVGNGETAFAHRDRQFFTTILSLWLDAGDDPQPHWDWTNALWDRINHEANGVYVNFLHDEGDERIREAYPAGTYERLVQVKEKYDPDNVFRFNQNIRPRE